MDRYLALTEALFKLKRNYRGSYNSDYLYKALGNPADSYKTIHVAGTNGKGSVTLKIASSLSCAGYRVGLFTSPHIYSFQERIQINGQVISKEKVVFYIEHLQRIFHKKNTTYNFFEMTTMIAFLYFQDERVDIAVIETGIGGRYDPTNVINPVLSVITNITKDHENYLGDSLDAIASQKAGIIKKGVPVLLGYRAVYPSVLNEVFIKKVPVTVMPPSIDSSYAVENSLIAKESLSILSDHFNISGEAILYGLHQEQPCRFECLSFPNCPLFIFDVAHNIDGLKRLTDRLKTSYPNQNYHIVFGMAKEKDYLESIKPLAEVSKRVYLITPEHFAPLETPLLKEAFYSIGYYDVTSYPTLEETITYLFENLDKTKDLVVVCGTFYIMKIVRAALSEHQVRLSLASSDG
jgi:dihydrofolate synthase/folylpolyglutamate synthase